MRSADSPFINTAVSTGGDPAAQRSAAVRSRLRVRFGADEAGNFESRDQRDTGHDRIRRGCVVGAGKGCLRYDLRCDQGPGIEDENIEKIFNPFFTTKETGTGLGLSVVYQIVTQHGGIVKAEKNPGGGMTFSVVVPLRQN
jgi:signal transduction histidine kinase